MRFKLNAAGVAAVARSPRVVAHVAGQALVVAAAVSAAAPERTGHFARSIEVSPAHPTAQGVEVTVFSTDIAAHIIEFGSVNNPPYSPFRRAAARLGLRLRGGGERL